MRGLVCLGPGDRSVFRVLTHTHSHYRWTAPRPTGRAARPVRAEHERAGAAGDDGLPWPPERLRESEELEV